MNMHKYTFDWTSNQTLQIGRKIGRKKFLDEVTTALI